MICVAHNERNDISGHRPMNKLRDLGWVTDLPEYPIIVQLSGGVASWLAGKRTVERYNPANVILLFADVLFENADTYVFLESAVKDLGCRYVRICEGRNPWEVFEDEKFIGNSQVDPCSRILKREMLYGWVNSRYQPEDVTYVVGFDWTEGHRLRELQKHLSPAIVEAPLMRRPYLEKEQIVQAARDAGLPVSSAYAQGFAHDNCGGRCVKAGQAHYARLLTLRPETYADVEAREQKAREKIGDVAILRDRRGGVTRPLPLTEFRGRVANGDFDHLDFGACSCLMPVVVPEGMEGVGI